MALLALLTLSGVACDPETDSTPTGEPRHIVLVPEVPQGDVSADVLADARDVIQERAEKLGADDTRVTLTEDSAIEVEVGASATPFPEADLYRPFLLQFCQPVRDAAGNIATAPEESVEYFPQSCSPIRAADGEIDSPVEYVPWASGAISLRDIVWEPAIARVDGEDVQLTSFLLSSFSAEIDDEGDSVFTLVFSEEGQAALDVVTDELAPAGLPLAIFLDLQLVREGDGDIVTPQLGNEESGDLIISGLTKAESRELERGLRLGSFPIPMKVIDISRGNQ